MNGYDPTQQAGIASALNQGLQPPYRYQAGGMVGPGGRPQRPPTPEEAASLERLQGALDENSRRMFGSVPPPVPTDTRSQPLPGEPLRSPEMSRMSPGQRTDYSIGRLDLAMEQNAERMFDMPAGSFAPRDDQSMQLRATLDNLIRQFGGDPTARNPGPYQYADGGMVGPGGVPQRPGMPPAAGGGRPGLAPQGGGQPLPPQQLMTEAQRFAQANPQQVQQIQQAIQQAMQTGELTQPELNMIVQMATVALQNPQMYSQLRQLAIQQGLATEQDISPQFDQGLLFTLVVVGQAMKGPAAPQAAPQMGGAPGGAPMPSMAQGGPLPKDSPNPDGSIPITAHEGEYVVPAHVVRAKGTEFFDKLVMGVSGGAKRPAP